jgi:hypothetical protein
MSELLSMNKARKLQQVAGWIIVVISFVHLGVTFVDYDRLSLRALWFVGSGFALLLIGGLNVITAAFPAESAYGANHLLVLTVVANSCGVILGILYVILTSGSQPQGPILVLLFATAVGAQMRR